MDYEVLKTYMEGGLDYVRSDTSAKGLMFVQMVATAIRMHLSDRIRNTNLKNMGIPLMISRLNTLHVCEDASGRRLSRSSRSIARSMNNWDSENLLFLSIARARA